jgi:hypothetical protein
MVQKEKRKVNLKKKLFEQKWFLDVRSSKRFSRRLNSSQKRKSVNFGKRGT